MGSKHETEMKDKQSWKKSKQQINTPPPAELPSLIKLVCCWLRTEQVATRSHKWFAVKVKFVIQKAHICTGCLNVPNEDMHFMFLIPHPLPNAPFGVPGQGQSAHLLPLFKSLPKKKKKSHHRASKEWEVELGLWNGSFLSSIPLRMPLLKLKILWACVSRGA